MFDIVMLVMSFVCNLFLAFLVYRANKTSITNRLFTGLTLVTSVWVVVNYYALNLKVEDLALFFVRLSMVFAAGQILFLYLLVSNFPLPDLVIKRKTLVLSITYTALVMVTALSPYLFTGIKSLTPVTDPTPGPGIVLFMILIIWMVGSTIRQLIVKTRGSSGLLHRQMLSLSIGIILTYGLIAISNFILVIFFRYTNLIKFTPIYTLILVGMISYSIVAQQLFDIRVIIRRTVVYSVLLAFTLGTYSLVIFVFTAAFGGGEAFDPKTFAANSIAALLIAVGFQPLQRWLTKATDKYLFKAEYNSQEVQVELSQKLAQALDIREAAQSLVVTLKTRMRLTRTGLITLVTEEGETLVKDVIQDGYTDQTYLQLPSDNLVLRQIFSQKTLLDTEFLRREAQSLRLEDPRLPAYNSMLLELDRLGVAVVIPLIVNDTVIGAFFVGAKMSGDYFSRSEIQFLNITASQTTNAIEKSRFWQEDQMKSEFVSIASHELLTPTAAMKGYLSMILDDNMGVVDETARKYLIKVAQSSDRLGKLVEDLLNVSRIESGRLKINKREFSLVESITKAVEELQVNAQKKALDLAFVAPTSTGLPNVYADADHVYRVLINLIGNAIKYTERGWVRVYVAQSDPVHIQFTVSDSGLGIPPEHIPHLFEKFYRADRKEIAGIQGTGLGLYISKRIIELMGGQMVVQSEVGKGTTFSFSLPIMGTVPLQAGAQEPVTPLQPGNNGNGQVSKPLTPPAILTNQSTSNPVNTLPAKS